MSLKSISFGPIAQPQIQAYAEASGDFNKIHLDREFARAAGLPDTIVQGMLTMGLVGESLHRWGVSTADILEFETKFKDIVPVNAVVIVSLDSISEDGRNLSLRASLKDGADVCHSTVRLNRAF